MSSEAHYSSGASLVETVQRYLTKTKSQELLIRSTTLISIYLLAFCVRLVRAISEGLCASPSVVIACHVWDVKGFVLRSKIAGPFRVRENPSSAASDRSNGHWVFTVQRGSRGNFAVEPEGPAL
jgi:hypothetical protein